MKKVLSILISMLAVAVLFASCTKSTEKILTKKNGKWDIVATYTYTVNGVLEDSESEVASITFEDKTFTYVSSDNDVFTGTWSASKQKATLIADGEASIFDIKESKKNSQEWENINRSTENGVTEESKVIWKLTRK